MTNQPRTPTYVFMSVDYTDGLTGQAARDSYKGVRLRVEYGAEWTERRSYFTGDFAADYDAAIAFVGKLGSNVPFMGSSSVDDYMVDAGYEAQDATPEPGTPGPAEGYYEVAFAVDTAPVFTNLTEEQRAELDTALGRVQSLLWASGGAANRNASDTLRKLQSGLDFPPGTDLSENERRAYGR